MFSTLSYDAVSFAALFCCFVLALGWVTTGILAKLRVKPPWRNWLARSAVNRKVGGSSPPGGVLFCIYYVLFRSKVSPPLTVSMAVTHTRHSVFQVDRHTDRQTNTP